MFQELLQILSTHRRTCSAIGVVLLLALIVLGFSMRKVSTSTVSSRTLEQELPSFGRFAAVSRLLDEGKESEALSMSYLLKEGLEKEDELYLHNLYRIVLLEGRCGTKEKELAALNELEKKRAFLESVREGELTLKDWVAYRKKVLSGS